MSDPSLPEPMSNPKNEYELKKEQKEQEKTKKDLARKRKKFFRNFVLVFVPLLAIGGWSWYMLKNKPDKPENSAKSELDSCVQHVRSGMHIHPQLTILVNGEIQKIPANIGISPVCMRPIHTHDKTGTLHLEFATQRPTKIGEFFSIWGKKFDQNCILDYCSEGNKKVKLFVNGLENFEFENYIMKDQDKIEIRYE